MALGLFGMVGAASAQQTMDDALQSMKVFDCTAEDQSALYVFRTGINGETVLLDDPSVPVRREGDRFSLITDEGAREISAEAYFVYNGGAAVSGTCLDTTATAQAIFPTMIDGLLMGSSDGMAEAAAARVLVEDMQIKMDSEIARITAEAEQAQAALVTKLETAQAAVVAELESTKQQLALAQSDLVAANEQARPLRESIASLTKALDVKDSELALKDAELAEKETELAAMSENFDKNLMELATARGSYDTLGAQIAELQADLAAAEASRAEIEAALAKENEISELKDAALERAMGRVDEVQAELEKVMRERRSLAANMATLNQRASDLAGKLGRAEADLNRAGAAQPERVTRVASSSSLTDVAIGRIATLQNRGVSDVQRELCNLLPSASRPARCGN